MAKPLKNILVVSVNWLGDVIFSAPVFAALKEKYPQARVTCLTHPRVEEVLRHIPNIDEIIVFDEDKKHRLFYKKLKFADRLRERNFDAAFLLRRSTSKALLLWYAGIKERIGYSDGRKMHFLTYPIAPDNVTRHRRDQYLNVLEQYGISVKDRESRLIVDGKSTAQLDGVLADNNITTHDKFVVIHPGGNWDLKRWPVQNYIRFIDELTAQKQYKVIISGGKGDIDLASLIASKCQSPQPIIFAGKLNLSQLAALFHKSQLVISADSGPLHLANSLGTKTIGIFGPTRPEITGPTGKGKSIILQHDVGCNRSACYYLECPDNICMKAVDVNEVKDAFKQMVS